jgi:hypothetical protein
MNLSALGGWGAAAATTTTTTATGEGTIAAGNGCTPGQTIASLAAGDHDDDTGAPSDGDGGV